MNIKRISIFFLLILVSTFTLIGFPLDSMAQDHTRWSLPKGAKARLGKGRMFEIACSADGTLLAIGSRIGVWIYEAESGDELDFLTGDIGGATSVAFSPDGKAIASGSKGGTVILWDTSPFISEPEISADVNADGVVNIQDLVRVAARIGQPVPADGDPADVNGDGVINIQDMVQVAGAIGN